MNVQRKKANANGRLAVPILGSSLGALFGLAEASALLWTGTLVFSVPRAAVWFVLTSAAAYSILGLALALVAGPRVTSGAIAAFLTLYSCCVAGHYFFAYSLRSPAFLLILASAALMASALWWLLHRSPPRHRLWRELLLLAAPVTILVLLAAQLVSMATTSRPSLRAPQGNVVLVTLDTLRPDRVGAYGYTAAKTPNLDRLARSGVLFRQAYTPVVLTGPAHAAIMTSGYPVDHSLRNNGQRIDAQRTTLAEVLRNAGYQTFAAVSVVHLDGHYSSLDKGFEPFYNTASVSPLMSLSAFRMANTIVARLGFRGLWTPFRTGSLAVDDFTSWLADHHQQPFFAWLHIYDAHFPYGAGETEASRGEVLCYEIIKGTCGPEDERVKQVSLLYDHGVSSADSQVGRILGALSKFGLQSKTLVIVASDHGETLANPLVDRRYWFHHADVYEDTAHVALLMSYPGKIPQGAVIDSPASLLDIAPTILSLVGMDTRPASFRGVDLFAPPGRRFAGEDRSCLMIQHAPNIPDLESLAVRQGCWKLILHRPAGPAGLYNLCQDPAETNDLAAKSPEVVARLRTCFEGHRRFFDLPATHLAPQSALANDLRSLGYL